MAKKIHHFPRMKGSIGNIEFDVHFTHIERNFNNAQFALDSAVMASMEPFMPKDTGQFIQSTSAMSGALAGSGVVVAAAPPYGRYLYKGKVMVDSETGKGPMKITDKHGGEMLRWREGAKLVPTKRNLKYSRPGAQSHWFDKAKEKDCDKWVDLVKKEIGAE